MTQTPRFDFEFICESINPVKRFGRVIGKASAISTDSRTIKSGECFLALTGPNFDGFNYINSAIAAGANALIVSKTDELEDLLIAYPAVAVFVVKDTLQALHDLACSWIMSKHKLTKLAITGSNGKTTTKEILASILSVKSSVLKTQGNLNNLIGLPLTVLNLVDEDFAVLEMGMNTLGEIEQMAKIVKPDLALITNINPAHLEGLKTLDNIAKAKGELFAELNSNSSAIINLDNPYTVRLAKNCPAKQISFSLENHNSDVFTTKIKLSDVGFDVRVQLFDKSFDVKLPLIGRHNISNMLAAIAAAHAVGASISQITQGIAICSVPGRRLKLCHLANGLLIIDDCYNANPSSMEAALELLVELSENRRSLALIGDMLELGEGSKKFHYEIGQFAAKLKINKVIAFGDFANDVATGFISKQGQTKNVFASNNFDSVKDWLKNNLTLKDTVLIKGSRGMKMERAIPLVENFEGIN